MALGYVSGQRVTVRTEQDVCAATASGPECITLRESVERNVDGFGYLSVQRRFVFRPDAWL
jgi:hypothetical protein